MSEEATPTRERYVTQEHAERVYRRWREACRLDERVRAIFGESPDEEARRLAAEIALDGDLAAIPHAHRLAVARQLLIALTEHGLLDFDRNYIETHLRIVARRLGVPYLELMQAADADCGNPTATRGDLAEWVAWCREHAPERLAEVR